MPDLNEVDVNAVNALPQDLKDAFIGPIRGMYEWHHAMMAAWRNSTVQPASQKVDDPAVKSAGEGFRAAVVQVREDFFKAGGTEPQFNVLAVAVYHGHFDPPAPRP